MIPLGARIRLIVCIALAGAAAGVPARADYPIGHPDVPKVVVHADAEQFQVYPKHPRLFFRDTDLAAIRKRIGGDYRRQWSMMAEALERHLRKQDLEKYAKNPYLKAWSVGRNMAFAALVTGDSRWRDWALRWADLMAAADPNLDSTDDDYRGRLMSLAVAYDWLYPWLLDSRRAAYGRAIVAHVERNWHFAQRPNFIGGHSRWGHFSLAAGLLAVVTEKPELRPKLLQVRRNLLAGFHPAQGWIAADGGYHMAWTYSAPYTDARNHCIWSSATNECVYYPWREHLPYLFLYGDHGDGTYPNSGDAYSWQGGLSEGADTLAVAAGVFKNRHAAAMLKPTWDGFYELLYGDPRVRPMAPDDPSDPLPLARHFAPSGVVLVRDRWDERTTHLAFKSSSFYSMNHHHRDENAFTLSYRGPLAIDSGYYDRYGSPHWWNYYTRTIAHNAVTVFDPAQEFHVREKLSNDGGQVFREEPAKLEDIRPGGPASLDGIVRYEHHDAFTYALGSAGKAYDPERVRLAQREIVYLRAVDRPHPVVIVFDRVESVRPEFEKTFILHAARQPTVQDSRCQIENGGGRLTCLTLWPERPRLRLVGGPGNEFSVQGVNYPPERLAGPWRAIAGAWRLEVAPPEKQTRDDFLHVLLVDDVESPRAEPGCATRLAGENCLGVEVGGWAVVFPRQREVSSPLSYTFPARASRHLIVGCPLGRRMQASVSNQPPLHCTAGPGGIARFDLPGKSSGTIRVQSIP